MFGLRYYWHTPRRAWECWAVSRHVPRSASVRLLAGHSHWHNVRHRKAREDEKRSSLFQRLCLAVTVAARQERGGGGGSQGGRVDEKVGPRLARAIEDARRHSVPRARIDAAVQAGYASSSSSSPSGSLPRGVAHRGGGSTGEDGVDVDVDVDVLEDVANSRVYECGFPNGVGLIVRLRASGGGPRGVGGASGGVPHGTSDVLRGMFARAGGKAVAVQWKFQERWTVSVRLLMGEDAGDEVEGSGFAGADGRSGGMRAAEALGEVGIQAGAEDVEIVDVVDQAEDCGGGGGGDGSGGNGSSSSSAVEAAAGTKQTGSRGSGDGARGEGSREEVGGGDGMEGTRVVRWTAWDWKTAAGIKQAVVEELRLVPQLGRMVAGLRGPSGSEAGVTVEREVSPREGVRPVFADEKERAKFCGLLKKLESRDDFVSAVHNADIGTEQGL